MPFEIAPGFLLCSKLLCRDPFYLMWLHRRRHRMVDVFVFESGTEGSFIYGCLAVEE